MNKFTYKPKGVCSQSMTFEMEGNIVKKVVVVGGCPGNLLGISRILENKTVSEIITSFQGVRCGAKKTSCPDQIAQALLSYANENGIEVK